MPQHPFPHADMSVIGSSSVTAAVSSTVEASIPLDSLDSLTTVYPSPLVTTVSLATAVF